MDWSELTPHLTGFAHIATVTPDGRPHVAKVAPAVEGDGLWLAMNTTSTTVRNLRHQPLVAVMFEPLGEAYVHAQAELVSDVATKRRLWNSSMFPFALESFFGPPDSDVATLIWLRPARATLSDTRRGWDHAPTPGAPLTRRPVRPRRAPARFGVLPSPAGAAPALVAQGIERRPPEP